MVDLWNLLPFCYSSNLIVFYYEAEAVSNSNPWNLKPWLQCRRGDMFTSRVDINKLPFFRMWSWSQLWYVVWIFSWPPTYYQYSCCNSYSKEPPLHLPNVDMLWCRLCPCYPEFKNKGDKVIEINKTIWLSHRIHFMSFYSITANAQGCCKLYSLDHGIANDVHDFPESEE